MLSGTRRSLVTFLGPGDTADRIVREARANLPSMMVGISFSIIIAQQMQGVTWRDENLFAFGRNWARNTHAHDIIEKLWEQLNIQCRTETVPMEGGFHVAVAAIGNLLMVRGGPSGKVHSYHGVAYSIYRGRYGHIRVFTTDEGVGYPTAQYIESENAVVRGPAVYSGGMVSDPTHVAGPPGSTATQITQIRNTTTAVTQNIDPKDTSHELALMMHEEDLPEADVNLDLDLEQGL